VEKRENECPKISIYKNTDHLYLLLLLVDCSLNQGIGDVEDHSEMKEFCCPNCL